MKIDAHIHYTPPSMATDLAAYSEKEPFWGLLITPDPVNHTEQGWATPERMIADMDKAGIDKVVLLGESQMRHENCVERNDQGIDMMQRWPDRVICFAAIQPKAGQKALDELKRCIDHGMLGVGELDPYGEGFQLTDPNFYKLVEACIDQNIPINLHMTEEIGHFYLGKTTVPLRHYYRLAGQFPELKLILAHWGGGILFYEIMPEVRKTLRNVWYDIAGTPLIFPTELIFRMALLSVDHKKILYGSDYPLQICKDKQNEPDFRPFISEIEALGLSREIYDDIMGLNAAKLLGLIPDDVLFDKSEDRKTASSKSEIITQIHPGEVTRINEFMAISAVANYWPETRQVFEKYNIAWKDSPVPFWEPIAQAAAAQMMGPKARQRFIDELNEVIGYKGA